MGPAHSVGKSCPQSTLLVTWIAFYPRQFIAVADSENIFPKQLSPEVLQAMKSVRFIAQHIKDADKDNEVSCEAGDLACLRLSRINHILVQ